jgi:hypothetical protein
MLGKWPIPNKLSVTVAPAGRLWIRRVLVHPKRWPSARAQEGQWPVRKHRPFSLGLGLAARAQEQLKSAGELTIVSQPADFPFVCCSSVPTPVAKCPPHTSKPRPNSGESCRHLRPMSDVGRQSLPDRSQEWRDRLRRVNLVRDEQLVMSVHLIVSQHLEPASTLSIQCTLIT